MPDEIFLFGSSIMQKAGTPSCVFTRNSFVQNWLQNLSLRLKTNNATLREREILKKICIVLLAKKAYIL